MDGDQTIRIQRISHTISHHMEPQISLPCPEMLDDIAAKTNLGEYK